MVVLLPSPFQKRLPPHVPQHTEITRGTLTLLTVP